MEAPHSLVQMSLDVGCWCLKISFAAETHWKWSLLGNKSSLLTHSNEVVEPWEKFIKVGAETLQGPRGVDQW